MLLAKGPPLYQDLYQCNLNIVAPFAGRTVDITAYLLPAMWNSKPI